MTPRERGEQWEKRKRRTSQRNRAKKRGSYNEQEGKEQNDDEEAEEDEEEEAEEAEEEEAEEVE